MGLDYNAASLEKAIDLFDQQKKIQDSVEKLLSKVKNGYFSGKDVVLKSGLKKAEVEKILEAQEKVAGISKQIKAHEKTFNSELNKSYIEEKKELEDRLKKIKGEFEDELKKFPSFLDGVVGYGPEKDFKDALKEMD